MTNKTKAKALEADEAKPVSGREWTAAESATAAASAAWVKDQQAKRGQPILLTSKAMPGGSLSMEITPEQAQGLNDFMKRAAGTLSRPFSDRLLAQIVNMHGPVKAEETGALVNSALAVLHGAAPANELEAMLIADVIGLQDFLSMSLFYASKADMRDARDQYGNMANKAARTIAALVDSLAKLRSGGKQQVEVRYVYVDARSQTIVGSPPGGGGGAPNFTQPHGQAAALAYAPGAPVWSQDPTRDGLPGAGDQGPAPMPLPRQRRQAAGRAARQGERPILDGTAHQGNRSDAGSPPGVDEAGEQPGR